MSSPHRNVPGAGHMSGVVRQARALVKCYPTDIAAVSAAAAVVALGAWLLPPGSALRFVLVLPLVVFLPGYATTAVLFTGSGSEAEPRWRTGAGRIDGVDRAGIGFGLSLAIVPLLVVAAGSIVELTVVTVVVALAGFTILVSQLAAVRRLRVPPEQRPEFHPVRVVGGGVRSFRRRSLFGKVTALVLVAGLVVGMGGVLVAVANPPAANGFSDFFVTTENEAGELVASDYPSSMVEGDSASLVVGVENHERRAQEYTVVVQLHRVEGEEVTERAELDRFSDTVPPGETWQVDHEATPTLVGEDLRLTYLLYRGEPPETPTRENAYHDLYVWMDVEASEDGS